MKFLSPSRLSDSSPATLSEAILPVDIDLIDQDLLEDDDDSRESTLLKTLGWVTAGLGALAVGMIVGRELRQRYKFNRRTPYDFYSHSGDEQDVDFGLGV